MTLNSILKEFPNIRLADASDNERILHYYASSQLTSGKQSIFYRRGNDFFSFLKEKSDKYLVFLLISDEGDICGVASLSYRTGYIDGVLQTVGYLGDLRISLNRKLIRQWRKMYASLIELSPSLSETNFCRYYQTALMQNNSHSRNNLANNKISGIQYELLENYQMINIVGRLFKKTSHNFTVNGFNHEEEDDVFAILESDNIARQFGLQIPQEISSRLSRWEDFSTENFIIVKNNEGAIVCVTYYWGPKSSKQILLSDIPLFFKFLNPVFKLIPFIKVYPLPKKMENLGIIYIHQLSFVKDLAQQSREEIMAVILNYLIEKKMNLNMISYCDFEKENLCQNLKGFLMQKENMSLYSVHHVLEDQSIRDKLSKKSSSASFDMSLV